MKYEHEYYFVCMPENKSRPYLTPDSDTEDRQFRFTAQPIDSPPLVFFNGAKDFQKKHSIPSQKNITDILFDGADMLIRGHVREVLLAKNIPNLYMHPAIYIHDDDTRHKDFWYVTFTERFDCWDRGSSNYEKEPTATRGGSELFLVYDYSLDSDLLDRTPLEQRLLFKMGGTIDGYIVCHESLAHLFRQGGKSGAELTLISDY